MPHFRYWVVSTVVDNPDDRADTERLRDKLGEEYTVSDGEQT